MENDKKNEQFNTHIRNFSAEQDALAGIWAFETIKRKYPSLVKKYFVYEYNFNSTATDIKNLIESASIKIYFLKFKQEISIFEPAPNKIGITNTNAELEDIKYIDLKQNKQLSGFTDFEYFENDENQDRILISEEKFDELNPPNINKVYFVTNFFKNVSIEFGNAIGATGEQINFQANQIKLSGFSSFALVQNSGQKIVLAETLNDWKNLQKIEINFNNNILFANAQLKGDIQDIEQNKLLKNYDIPLETNHYLMPILIKPINVNNNLQVYINWFFQNYAMPKKFAEYFNVLEGKSIFDYLNSSPNKDLEFVKDLVFVMKRMINASIAFLSNLEGIDLTKNFGQTISKYTSKPKEFVNNLWQNWSFKYQIFINSAESIYAQGVLKMISNFILGDLAINNGGDLTYQFLLPWFLEAKNKIVVIDEADWKPTDPIIQNPVNSLELIGALRSNWYEFDLNNPHTFTPKKINLSKSYTLRSSNQIISFPIISNPITELNFSTKDTANDQAGELQKWLVFVPFNDLSKLNSFLDSLGTYDEVVINNIPFDISDTKKTPHPSESPAQHILLTKEVIPDKRIVEQYAPTAKEWTITDEGFSAHAGVGYSCGAGCCYPNSESDQTHLCYGDDGHEYKIAICRPHGYPCQCGSATWTEWRYRRYGTLNVIALTPKNSTNPYVFTEYEFYEFIKKYNSANLILENKLDPTKKIISNINSLTMNICYGDKIDLTIHYLDTTSQEKTFIVNEIQLLNYLDEKRSQTKIIF